MWSLPNYRSNGDVRRDLLFWRIMLGGFGVIVLYGLGMVVAILFADEALALRMLNIFPSLLVGVLSLGSGYLVGRQQGSSQDCECAACVEARHAAAERRLGDS